jgi:hypothetical protein
LLGILWLTFPLFTLSWLAFLSLTFSRPLQAEGWVEKSNAIALYFCLCLVRKDGHLSEDIDCYQCGESLATLSLPLSRRDQCPHCNADIHVCKMCIHFDARVTRQCREDGAEDVTDKQRPNFCDWFVPSDKAFDADRKFESDAAKDALDALFGG